MESKAYGAGRRFGLNSRTGLVLGQRRKIDALERAFSKGKITATQFSRKMADTLRKPGLK